MGRWENGEVDPALDAEAQARVRQLEELRELTLSDIHRLYGVQEATKEAKK